MHEDESSNERHRSGHRKRHRHGSESRSRRHHHDERSGRRSSAPEREEHNWVFILVLTNFISLTVGAYVGHRYWDDILSLTGEERRTTHRSGRVVEPMERHRQYATVANELVANGRPPQEIDGLLTKKFGKSSSPLKSPK